MNESDGWTVQIGGHGAVEVRDAQLLQARVYGELGFVTAEHTMTAEGLLADRWSPASTHYAAFIESEAVGHLRLIDRRAGELPVETLVDGLELPETCVEVSSLAVAPEYADGHPAMLMYRSAFHHSTDNGFTHWACLLERPLLRTLIDFFNFPFEEVGPEVNYAGITVPAMVDLYKVWARVESGEVDGWFGR